MEQERDYHKEVLNERAEDELKRLLFVLREKRDFFLKHLRTSAIMFDSPNWRLTLHNQEDYRRVVGLIQEKLNEGFCPVI